MRLFTLTEISHLYVPFLSDTAHHCNAKSMTTPRISFLKRLCDWCNKKSFFLKQTNKQTDKQSNIYLPLLLVPALS